MADADIETRISHLRQEMTNFNSTLGSSPPAITEIVERDLRLLTEKATLMENSNATMIQNDDNEKCHRVLLRLGHKPTEWQTFCGWKFGLSSYTDRTEMPENWKLLCSKCFNAERKAHGKKEMDQANSTDTFLPPLTTALNN